MSEYEVASLGLRQAALTATYWQTGISTGLSLLTLAIPSGLVLYGFRLMRRGTEQRAREADQRHTEAMTALRTLINGTERSAREADRRHAEAMTALHTLISGTEQGAREADQRHTEAMTALHTLIERTAPQSAPGA